MLNRQSSKTTTDHDEIRRWVESKGGCPSHVKSTGRGRDLGVLRIDYPGRSGKDTLEETSWDDWFEAFEANNLAFVYQPSTRFSKLVERPAKAAKPVKRSRTAKKTASKGARRGEGTTTKSRAPARGSRATGGPNRAPKRGSSTKRRSARA